MRQEDLPRANAQCKICSSSYYRCEQCIKMQAHGVNSWRLYCDTPKCYLLYVVLESFKNGNASKIEVVNALNEYAPNHDFSGISDVYRDIIDDMFNDSTEAAEGDGSLQNQINIGDDNAESAETPIVNRITRSRKKRSEIETLG